MATVAKLTVFFEDPFWVGICERADGDRLEVCRVVFGAEPRDGEVYTYFLEHWTRLRFSPEVRVRPHPVTQCTNPKRLQRAIQKQLASPALSTKAQQAIQLQREEAGEQRRHIRSLRRQEEQARRYAQRTAKRKQKHKGR